MTTSTLKIPADIAAQVDSLRARYPTSEALLLPLLHLLQRHHGGWLPPGAVAAAADHLGLPAAKVAGVVSFYDLFHEAPVGRHRIRLCTNLSCQLRGAEELMEVLREELAVEPGRVTSDGRASYVEFECLGSCDTAPVAMIDDDYHENLTPARLRDIVRGLK